MRDSSNNKHVQTDVVSTPLSYVGPVSFAAPGSQVLRVQRSHAGGAEADLRRGHQTSSIQKEGVGRGPGEEAEAEEELL